MSAEDLPKVCPSCKQKDLTSFSKCRFCGTRYDAIVTVVEGPNILRNLLLIICTSLSVLAFVQVGSTAAKQAHEKEIAWIAAEVRASNKPRVLEFYADWCGPCRSYGPVVEQSQAKFAGRVDFKRYNVDDGGSHRIARAIGVRAIPRTCILDRKGNIVEDRVGTMDQEMLDGFVQKAMAVN